MLKCNNSGFIHFIPLLLIAVVVLVISFADFKSMFKTDLSNQSVLSESSDSEDENKNEDEDKEDDPKDVEDNDNDSDKNESSQKPAEQESDDSTNEESDDESFDDTKIDDDTEDGTENEIEIDSEDNSKLKIKIKSNGNEFEFESEGENVNVQSNFPLSIDPETNELTVTTPNGEKVVTVLPDQAISNMMDNGKLTLVISTDIDENENGELEYQIEGQDEEKLFGVFNIKIHKIFTVSALTGQETSSKADFLNKILDLLSV